MFSFVGDKTSDNPKTTRVFSPAEPPPLQQKLSMANIRTKILDLRGFDSSRSLILRAGILMSTVDSPEMLSQRILVGVILAGRLGVQTAYII